jgi:hypothetical protein
VCGLTPRWYAVRMNWFSSCKHPPAAVLSSVRLVLRKHSQVGYEWIAGSLAGCLHGMSIYRWRRTRMGVAERQRTVFCRRPSLCQRRPWTESGGCTSAGGDTLRNLSTIS